MNEMQSTHYSDVVRTLPLVPMYPCCDLDGQPWPGCEHQTLTTNPSELAIIRAIARGIIEAGIPEPPARAGDRVTTTWGCGKNKRKTRRDAIITSVIVGLRRHPRSMWYLPKIGLIGREPDKINEPGGMWLTEVNGTWNAALGEDGGYPFRLEWVSPITEQIVTAWPAKAGGDE